ncbi:hypothetical protein MPSEU_000436700 [Mayamaea pseudoterrestris]|nr:hypothetical protein MPSEU_000436700 [Mayamaea pseudoterrestris]
MDAPPDCGRKASDAEIDEPKKRAAFAGQWRTPPLPVFPTSTSILSSEHAGDSSVNSNNNNKTSTNLASEVPLSTEDYQKALQEAYRRGAEATAMALAQGVTPNSFLPTAASCPDFQQEQQHDLLVDPSSMQQQLLPPEQSANTMASSASLGNIASNASMPPPSTLPPSMAAHNIAHANAATRASMNPSPLPIGTGATVASSTMQQQQQQQQQRLIPFQQPAQQRSMSLPDMTSYGAKQEEEKRQKRLARNRASARLRRLRKKNLVDAYETEVGILEKTLEQLQVHEWGTQDNPRALVEALSMDRGQQVLSTAERQQTATDILEQQLEYIGMLEEMMQEQYVLHRMGHDAALEQELRAVLGLTDDQVEQLASASAGWQDEWDALQTVKTSLHAMKDNNWLWNEGCNAVAEEFMSLLHKNQVSKLLLWADHNVEAIDELDVVNAPSQIAQGPIFHFGVNSSPEGLLDEERTQGE